MALPEQFRGRLRLPVVSAPMFLVSGPELVINACRAGIVGTFPALNARTSEDFETWLLEIKQALAEAPDAAPFGVNLIVHKSNPRLQEDLQLCVKHEVPLVITSLGAVADVVDAVHSYGGIVFHDVINVRHGQKAAAAGVDGLIAVCAGAGGHAGTTSPFALVRELRSFFDKTLLLAGSLSTGADVLAARAIGADLAYLGTRFINTTESLADQAYKEMIVESGSRDIVYTEKVSGVNANFLAKSLQAAGMDPATMEAKDMDFEKKTKDEAKAWKNIWSAGHGVGAIGDVLPVAELVERMRDEYQSARRELIDNGDLA
ncbi:nitronate monooxygenase family protein [Granulosicoccaceae sp. 1_MG-2023]|nr:nitronate monooxygenase family protein [Granulosicoccaceae sp. 1_MG-2023]